MTGDIHGIHHTGILTRDLDGLERTYASFGFTLSPRSRHLLGGRPGEAPVPGCTANRCALFGGSCIELLGIVDESAPTPWRTKATADEYDGFQLINLDTDDAESTHRRTAGAGLHTSGVLDSMRSRTGTPAFCERPPGVKAPSPCSMRRLRACRSSVRRTPKRCCPANRSRPPRIWRP
ncbi:VOC family protein [Streptomyces europaeiscabiei]|uniref:VOC family protein n=1 Tax=Streptomyces europaeiscabiei TaxID=146819 RepID=UPI0038F6A0D6